MWNKPFTYLIFSFLAVMVLSAETLSAQKKPIEYYGGAYQVYTLKEEGLTFKIFDMNISRGNFKVAYFGQNGAANYKSWKRGHSRVLCYFAVGFAQDWAPDQPPLGLSVQQGRILNRNMEADMDGLVSLTRQGTLKAVNISAEKAEGRYDLTQSSDRSRYLRTVGSSGSSIFQTQLMYTAQQGSMMGDLKYGQKSSRRFLAICTDKRGQTHHLVMDVLSRTHLNNAAAKAIVALKEKGFTVQYLLNQDTGGRNIMEAFNDRGDRIYLAPVDISKATQLLVYYR